MAAVNRVFKQLLEQQCSSTKLPLEIHMDRTHEILRLATVCIAVSGSVGLELLYHGVPSAISYHVHPVGWLSTVALKKVRWISLVNLLANRTVLPEFMSFRCQSGQIAAQLNDWLSSPKKAAAVREQLFSMAQEHAVPGACIRAAEYIVRNMPGHIHHLAHQRVSVERYRHFIQPTRDVTHADSALESGSTSLAKEPA
jgi:lipid-A-disaccharide synthase